MGTIGTTAKSPFSDPGVSTVRHSQRPPTPAPSVPGFLGGSPLAPCGSQTAQTGLPFTPPTPAASLAALPHKPCAQPASGILRRNSSAIFTEDETLDWQSALQRPSRSVTFELPNFLSDISGGQKARDGFSSAPQPHPLFSSAACDVDPGISLANDWAAQELAESVPSHSALDDARENQARLVPSAGTPLPDAMLFGQSLPASDIWTEDSGYAFADTTVSHGLYSANKTRKLMFILCQSQGSYDPFRSLTPDLGYAHNDEGAVSEEGMYDHWSDVGEHW